MIGGRDGKGAGTVYSELLRGDVYEERPKKKSASSVVSLKSAALWCMSPDNVQNRRGARYSV
jgi:hypothetical protein